VTCHNCKTECKRFGFTKQGWQRHRCNQCSKTFSEIPERPLDDLRIDPAKAVQVVHLLCEGVGIRAASRLTGVHQQTVLNILEVAGQKCAKLLDVKLRNLIVEQVQCDELFAFVGCKQQNTAIDDLERGDQYTYLSVDRKSKLIVSHFIGKRTGDNCHLFMQDLKQRIACRFQLSTDGFTGYVGHRGAVFQTFKDGIDYGTEMKYFGREIEGPRRYSPVVCVWTKRTSMIGDPDVDFINTSHAERTNLSVRLFSRRHTRLTLGYSKKLRYHKYAVALFIAHFNFCRTHSALKLKATDLIRAQEQTPAMAANLTSHIWSIEELLQQHPAVA
jgi:transposase-like protein/IS1 family transposase